MHRTYHPLVRFSLPLALLLIPILGCSPTERVAAKNSASTRSETTKTWQESKISPTAVGVKTDQEIKSDAPKKSPETVFMKNIRQLTFTGFRAGEGYYSADGKKIVFQSERQDGNPFYQIYLLDLETGDTQRISPGYGKTTCAWIHPENNRVLLASTHDDPEAKQKQLDEIATREEEKRTGKYRRYTWDYDEDFDVYSYDLNDKSYTNLTNVKGYDAEGSYSPDGKLIAFASNRLAYSEKLSPEDARRFENDQTFLMDLYIMNADGTNVKRLTTERGYDGGPFFSPDGKRICWRHFDDKNEMVAEIWTMNIDGSDKKQLTRMNCMSWAPFYHPSGKYLVFNTNKHGLGNFELYLVDVDGSIPPIRVTDNDGFDALASFSPDGKKITWTSNRAKKQSQLFTADWNHEAALNAIGAAKTDVVQKPKQAGNVATAAAYRPEDVLRHVQKLCAPEMEGRMTGSRGERLATEYVAAYLDSLGLVPSGEKSKEDESGWFQYFDFPSGTSLEKGNSLVANIKNADGKTDDESFELNKQWRPLSYSGVGKFEPAEIVFAGYGISAPKTDEFEAYDSYVHLDVKDKWVMVFRYVPDDISPKLRQHLQFYSTLRRKATLARDNGARGMIIVSGPNSQVRDQLIPLQNGTSRDATSMAVVSVTDELAGQWLKTAGKDLKELQTEADTGKPQMGFPIRGVKVSADVAIKQEKGRGRNVIGRLQAGNKPSEQVIVIGAHIDHLGRGISGTSLAREDEQGKIHVGADDNASGVAAMLEIAEYLADQKKQGKLDLKRDIVFAAWSGEELNLYGSKYFVAELKKKLHPHSVNPHSADPHSADPSKVDPHASAKTKNPHVDPKAKKQDPKKDPHAKNPQATDPHAADPPATDKPKSVIKPGGIYPYVAAYLNLDMVGRFDKALILQGLGSSKYWRPVIEKRNVVVQLSLTLSDDTNLPTDAREFYAAGVPILAAFTGSHSDYHSPRDTPEKLNYDKASDVAKLLGLIARDLVLADKIPAYTEYEGVVQMPRGGMRATIGTIPDYAGGVKGVLLSGATKGKPAAKAGVKGGDIVVELAGKKIENIYDYTYAIDALKIGQKVKIVVLRDGKRLTLDIVPESKQ
jgi:Tol biopolymer transport system component/Zn-dependent M28 family amino/carboxypeptidase